ncbi:hypothetical protein ACWD6N_35505 [Micromonospora sp. NPDC005163]
MIDSTLRGDRLGFLEIGASHRPGHRAFMETESITTRRDAAQRGGAGG